MTNETQEHYRTNWQNRFAPHLQKLLIGNGNQLKQDPNYIFWCPGTPKDLIQSVSGS
jgi:hypothetical protein